MFGGFTKLKYADLTGADCSKVNRANCMFYNCTSLEKVVLTGTDFSSATTISDMFYGCRSLKEVVDLTVTSPNLEYLDGLFNDCFLLPRIDNLKLNTAKVKNFAKMFYDCYSLYSVDLSHISTENATSLVRMFDFCYSLRDIDLSGFNTQNVRGMVSMFGNCHSLVSLDLSSFDTSNVISMEDMFSCCFSLENVDLSSFDTANCTDFSHMFSSCYSLRDVDLSSFTISDTAQTNYMLYGWSLRKVTLGDGISSLSENVSSDYAPYGWVNENDPNTVVSTAGTKLALNNSGVNTYIKNPCKGKMDDISITINKDGTLGMRVRVTLPDTMTEEEKSSACIVFSYQNHGRYETIPLKSDGNGGYYADYPIYAKEMISQMLMGLKIGNAYVDQACCSVRQYADKILADPVTYANEQDLIKSMLIYGGAAQRHFNYFANDYHEPTADCGIEYSKTVINSANNFTAPADLAELGYYGSSIVLGSGVVQRHYFELTSGDIADYTFIADGKSVAPTESGTPSLYYIDAKKNGAAMKLYDPSTITVYKTSEPDKTMSFDYSVMDYVRLAQNDSNITGTTAFDVIKTLSWMADEAKAYFENK